MDFGLKAGKNGACIEVKWNRVQAGACYVKYEVVFRNASRNFLSCETGYNIGEMMMCNLSSYIVITYVQLTVSFKATFKNFTANVTEATISSQVPTTPGMTLFCSFLLALLISFANLYKSRNVLNVITRQIFELHCRCSLCVSLH